MDRQQLIELEKRIRSGRIAYKELTVTAIELANTVRITQDELEALKELLELVSDVEFEEEEE